MIVVLVKWGGRGLDGRIESSLFELPSFLNSNVGTDDELVGSSANPLSGLGLSLSDVIRGVEGVNGLVAVGSLSRFVDTLG